MNKGSPKTHRGLLTFCVVLSVIMQALDTTIANVALPYMQGSVSASADQINWVLTSYIVAAAIMTQPSAFLARRFGRKRVLLVSITGFVVTSILCGLAQSLEQIIVFRLLQGLAGAALVPLAQGIMLDSYDLKERGSAMAIFGVSVMVGPVLGPVIGGWLTEHLSWRWVFFINLPVGLIAFIGLIKFASETPVDRQARLDWMGFSSLSIAILFFQLFLDRGELLDWFSSGEIIIEFSIGVAATYIFLVHTFTTPKPFVSPSLFKDRNFVLGVIFIFMVGITSLSSLALITPYLQKMMGYPVLDAGLALGPRGLGTMLSMFLVGRLMGQVDARWLLFGGLLLSALSIHWMTTWTPDISMQTLVLVGFVQGVSLGMLFVPLNSIAFATLEPALRAEGISLFSLMRNVGSSVGISIVTVMLARNTQVLHEELGSLISPFNRSLEGWQARMYMSPDNISGRSLLDQTITFQASSMAYLNDFMLLMWMTIVVMPLLLLLRPSDSIPARREESGVMD